MVDDDHALGLMLVLFVVAKKGLGVAAAIVSSLLIVCGWIDRNGNCYSRDDAPTKGAPSSSLLALLGR